jgi:site-specific DNA recombinase
MTAKPILCDLYLRLSDDKHAGGTFEDRVKRLRERAAQLGWTVRNVVVENDVINGDGTRSKSASAFKRRKVVGPDGREVLRVYRPGFRQILDDLAADAIQALLAEDLDRVTRDPRDLEDLIDILRDRKGSADSLSGSLRLTNGGADSEIAMARIMVTLANKSSADTARRVAEARRRQAENGQHGGGRRPYGFNADGITLNPDEAEVIRYAAGEILSDTFGLRHGPTLASIAKHLRATGTPTVVGGVWDARSLRDVLIKPRNAGLLVHWGEVASRLEGEPILTEDIYEAVIAKLNDPARRRPGRAPCWLGTNLYRCVCESPMQIQARNGRLRAYRCARKGGTGSVHVLRVAAPLDAYVSALIVRRLSRPDAAELVVPTSGAVDVKALRAQAAAQREKLEELARDRADDLITREQMITGTRKAKEKLAVIEGQLASATNRSPLSELAGADDVKAAWDELPLAHRRSILDALVTVTVLPAPQGARTFAPSTVRVAWKR